MSSEDKRDANAIDSSKTREFPGVSFDNVVNKENPKKDIQLSRESPKVLSENALERMVEKRMLYAIQNMFKTLLFSVQ